MNGPQRVRIRRILIFPQTIVYSSLFAICSLLPETKTMPRLTLAAGGANLGSPPSFFTDEEKEHLQLFRRIFDVDITDANTQIALITKSTSTKDWTPTRHHIIELVRQHIIELMGNDKIVLQPAGEDNGPRARSTSTIPSALADLYRKKGYEVDEPERGLQDFIAYTLVQAHDQATLLSNQGRIQYTATMQMSTFGVALPAMFASLGPLAKEITALHKIVIIGLGDKLTEPIKLVVYTTLANISKWPTSHVKAVELSQKFIMDQVLNRRVSLEPRLEGAYFGKGFTTDDGEEDNTQVGTGEIVRTAMAGSLPQTFVDLVDCFFPPDVAVDNHIVDIARMSMQLAGNHSLPPPSAASPVQRGEAFDTPTPPDGHSGFSAAPSPQVPNELADYGSNNTPESDQASEASFYTPSSPQAVITDGGPSTFPMHSLLRFHRLTAEQACSLFPTITYRVLFATSRAGDTPLK